MENLDIKTFDDYRKFLGSFFEQKSQSKYGFSFRSWARDLGFSDASSLTKIINGQRHPGKDSIHKFVRYFEFERENEDYFRNLIKLSKAKNDAQLKELLHERLVKTRSLHGVKILSDATFDVLSNWYSFAIRELLRIVKTDATAEELAKKLRFRVSTYAVNRTLYLLKETGLIKKDQTTGRLEATSESIDTTPDKASLAARRFFRQSLVNADQALSDVDVLQREFNAVVFTMRSQDIDKVKTMMRRFRSELSEALKHKDADGVFQFQMQFFPLTKETLDV